MSSGYGGCGLECSSALLPWYLWLAFLELFELSGAISIRENPRDGEDPDSSADLSPQIVFELRVRDCYWRPSSRLYPTEAPLEQRTSSTLWVIALHQLYLDRSHVRHPTYSRVRPLFRCRWRSFPYGSFWQYIFEPLPKPWQRVLLDLNNVVVGELHTRVYRFLLANVSYRLLQSLHGRINSKCDDLVGALNLSWPTFRSRSQWRDLDIYLAGSQTDQPVASRAVDETPPNPNYWTIDQQRASPIVPWSF